MKKRNILLGIAYAAFAVVGIVYTLSWPYVSTTGLNPSFWPTIMFGLLLVCAIAIIIITALGPDEEVKDSDKFNLKKSVPTIIWVGLYIYAFQKFGFMYPTMVFLLGEMFLFGEKRLKFLLPISVLMPVILYYLFTKAFGIYLP